MIEIKFRAVIPERNAKIVFTLEDLIMAHLDKSLFSIREILIPWLLAGNEPDRYTGLTDKNGVEIYETDRVSFIKTYNNKRYVGEVRYVNVVVGYMLCAMNNEPWHSFEFGLGTVELEVLGE